MREQGEWGGTGRFLLPRGFRFRNISFAPRLDFVSRYRYRSPPRRKYIAPDKRSRGEPWLRPLYPLGCACANTFRTDNVRTPRDVDTCLCVPYWGIGSVG